METPKPERVTGVELTEDEIDSLVYEAGPDADHDRVVFTVERIIAARLAPLMALLDETEADAREHQHLPRLGTARIREALRIRAGDQTGDDRG